MATMFPRFLVGAFAGALASFFPRLVAVLGGDPNDNVVLFSSTYLLVVEAAPDSQTPGGSFTLSVARNYDGICTPADGDGFPKLADALPLKMKRLQRVGDELYTVFSVENKAR